ncbi:MAG: LuxR C-terminal-related transcriptional regulator [Bacteroidales bacterium]|nr:LuxR C-terminal-related transcriptional regulator [Bacteroidales bacterium]
MKPIVDDFFIPDNEVKAPVSDTDSDIPAIIEMAKGVATHTERQVLLMSFQGLSQQEIADAIHYSVDTIKHIKRQLFERFGVKNIAQAVSYAANYRLF